MEYRSYFSLPNLLSFFRIFSSPLLFFLILSSDGSLSLLNLFSFLLMSLSFLSDFLDGFFARNGFLQTKFGEFLDPFADKILVLTLFSAIYFRVDIPLCPLILIVMRELFSFFMRGCSIFGKIDSFRTSYVAKLKTDLQMLSLFFLSTTVFFRSILHEFEVIDFWIEIGKFFLVVAAIFSVHSLLLYLARIDLDLKSFSVGRFGEQLLSFFEAGYFPVSQGSYASFFSYLLIYYSGISRIVSFVIFVLLFFAGLFFACKFEKELSEYDLPSSDLKMRVVSPFSFLKNFFHFSMELGHDSRIIVVDEVAAVFLIFSVFELGSFWISLLPLLIFRFFDITKIFGISFLEKRMRGGFAVMFDDLLAAVYSIFLFAIIKHIFL